MKLYFGNGDDPDDRTFIAEIPDADIVVDQEFTVDVPPITGFSPLSVTFTGAVDWIDMDLFRDVVYPLATHKN